MRGFPAVMALAVLASVAFAQAPAQDREKLVAIYKVTISHELCKFELTDDQADAVGKASDKLEEQLGLTDEDAQKLYDQIQATLEQQKPGGLCDANGEWSKVYKQSLADLAK